VADPTGPAQAVQQARRVGEREFAKIQAEDPAIKEGQGGMRLLQAGQRVVFRLGDALEEAAHVAGRKLAGVPLVIKQHHAARPLRTAAPRAGLAEPGLGHLADEVEKATRLGRGNGECCGGRYGATP
jgi:hypothetical protein